MRFIFYFKVLLLLFVFNSCRRSGSSDNRALEICNCYDQIHNESVLADSEIELQKKVNTCNELFRNTLSSIDGEEKNTFLKAYRDCQEN